MKSYNKAEISIGTNTGSLRKRHDFTPPLIAPGSGAQADRLQFPSGFTLAILSTCYTL